MTTGLVRRDSFEVPDILKFFSAVIVAVVMADVALSLLGSSNTLVSQYVRSQSYVGVSDPRIVEATYELQYLDLVNGPPYTPWVSAQLVNDGPSSVWVAVNQPDAAYELMAEETASVYRIGAQERISTIFFKCSLGETTSIRVVGEY